MDNDSVPPAGNQPPSDSDSPVPIVETVDDGSLQPEEVAASVSNPDEALFSVPLDVPPDQSFYTSDTSNRRKFIIIGAIILFFVIILIIILRLLLPGSGPDDGGGKKNAAEATLDYWVLWQGADVYKPVIEEYRKNNPNITINVTEVPKEEYLEKLIARSQNNVGPDIFRFHNTWLPELTEVLTPIPPDIMSNEEFEQTFYPVHARDLKVDQYYYGIPLMIDGLVLVYNETLFENAGLSGPPASPDDMARIAGRLTVMNRQTESIEIAGLALGSAQNVEHFSDLYGLWLLQNFALDDADIANKTRTDIWKYLLQIDSAPGLSIFETFRSFAENNTWSDTMPNSVAAFIQQKVAMIIVPSWQVHIIKEQNPDIRLKVAPVPQFVQRNNNPVSLATYWVEGVSRYSKNQEQAWRFVKFLSEKETMQKLYASEAQYRIFGEPYSRVDLADSLKDDPYVGPVIEQAPYFYSLPLNARTFDGVSGDTNIGGLNDAIIKYLENAVNTRASGGSSADALQTAKKGIEQVFTKYSIQ